jgi:hypothetical protein
MKFIFLNVPLMLAAAFTLGAVGASGSDWGYEEDQAPNTVQYPAGDLNQAARRSMAPSAEMEMSPVEQWVELYSFISPTPVLPDDQREAIRAHIEQKLNGPRASEVTCITKFWPALKQTVIKKPEQEVNYQRLLRALLRMQYRSLAGTVGGDQDILAQALGPLRIAAPGNPPLTEDAIEAYCDMACFLFEQKNPGRTMDATDNRTVFANVLREKFKEAPTQKDRLAMVNFDVDWSKFRISWTASNTEQRKVLLLDWLRDKSTPRKPGVSVPKDPTLLAVLQNGPWAPLMASTNSGLDAHPQAANAKPNPIRLTGK